MKNKRPPRAAAFLNARFAVAFLFYFAGILLTIAGFKDLGSQSGDCPNGSDCQGVTRDSSERYMPVPGGEADDLESMEIDWHNRLTYPTGRFDPAWVRQAAAQDAQIARAVPAGLHANNLDDRSERGVKGNRYLPGVLRDFWPE